jgi:hypothetical protein
VLVGVAFVVAVYGPYLWPLDAYGTHDSDRFLSWQLAVNDALSHGELLHWNPYACGGVPGLAEPESGALSPLNVLGLVLPPAAQQKAELLLHLAACALGFQLIVRRLLLSEWLGLLGFFVAAGNGFIVFAVLHGQATFLPFLLVALLVTLAWPDERGEPAPRGPPERTRLALGIGVVSLMILEDGFQVLLYASLLLGALALASAWKGRSLRPLATLAAWLVVPPFLCAARTFPMLLRVLPHARVKSLDFMTADMASKALFSPLQVQLSERYWAGAPHLPWWAYGAFVGVLPVVLAVVGIATRRTAAVAGLTLATVAGVALFFGRFAPWAPWALLHRVPPMTLVRFPNRFISVAIVAVAVLSMIGAASTLALVRRRAGSRGVGWVTGGLLFVVGIDLAGATSPMFQAYATSGDPGARRIDHTAPFRMDLGRHGSLLRDVGRNVASVACSAPLRTENHARPDLKSAFLLGEGTAVFDVAPNELVVRVDAKAPTTLVIDQNYDRDFVVSEGRVRSAIVSIDGLLGVDVPEGRQTVRLRFVPVAFRLGLAMSVTSLSAVAWLLFGRRPRPTTPRDAPPQRLDSSAK